MAVLYNQFIWPQNNKVYLIYQICRLFIFRKFCKYITSSSIGIAAGNSNVNDNSGRHILQSLSISLSQKHFAGYER